MKKMSLVTSKFVYYLVSGLGWFLYALFSLFDGLLFEILSPIALLLAVIISGKTITMTNETDDEMSEYNLTRAKAKAMDRLKLIICILLLIIAIGSLINNFIQTLQIDLVISLKLLVSITIGIADMLIAVFFVRYEKAGE